MRIARRLQLCFLALFSLAIVASAADEPEAFQASARERLQRDLGAWRASLPESRPRTFFTPEQWKALPRRWDGASARDRRHLEAALARARVVAAEPKPVYITPESQVAEGMSVSVARPQLWQRPVGDKMVLLAFALAVDPRPEFREALRTLVLTACEYPTWGMHVYEGVLYYDCDLAAAHVGRGVAIAYDWHPDLWSDAEKKHIRETMRVRMNHLLAAAYGDLWWGDNYQDNHNHVDTTGLGLAGLAFLDEIPEAGEWLAHAVNNFERVARETNADGSSPEGVPYWSYSVSFLLQFIEGTRAVLPTGALYDAPFFRSTAGYRLASSTPGFVGTLPWGDSPQRDYYGPHHLLYRLAAEYRDPAAQYLADNLPFPPQGPSGTMGTTASNDISAWIALWHDRGMPATPPRTLDRHLSVGDLVTTRNGWGAGDYLLAIKSGFNNRSHSHLDAGAIAFAFGDEWLITTPGYGTGFSNPEFWDSNGPRWNYFSNRTESHSTLVIDGENQSYERHTARGRIDGFATTPEWCWTSIDLTAAYTGIERVSRQVLHRRSEYVLVLDRVRDSDAHRVEWLAQTPPAGEADGPALNIPGAAGSLRIETLSPGGAFAIREPNAPHVDVPPERLRTWAVAAEGNDVEFATLLVPRFAGTPAPEIHAGVASRDGRREVKIGGTQWMDTVIVGEAIDDLSVEGCSARAGSLIARSGENGVESLLALRSDRLETPEFALRADRPDALGLRRVAPDVWLVYTASDRPVDFSGEGRWTFAPWPAEAGEAAGASAVVYRGERGAMLEALESL